MSNPPNAGAAQNSASRSPPTRDHHPDPDPDPGETDSVLAGVGACHHDFPGSARTPTSTPAYPANIQLGGEASGGAGRTETTHPTTSTAAAATPPGHTWEGQQPQPPAQLAARQLTPAALAGARQAEPASTRRPELLCAWVPRPVGARFASPAASPREAQPGAHPLRAAAPPRSSSSSSTSSAGYVVVPPPPPPETASCSSWAGVGHASEPGGEWWW